MRHGIDYVEVEKWYAMQKCGEVVVVLHDPNPYVIEPSIDKPIQIVTKRPARGWDGCKEISKVEAETLDVICEVPTIELTQFHRWEEETYPSKLPPKGWWKRLVT